MKRGSVKISDSELCSQWDYHKNDVSPDDVPIYSNQKRWWKGLCGHSWQTSPNNRSKGKGCPYCSGKLTAREHSLLFLHPEIAKEWNVKNAVGADGVRPKSGKKVWWKCKDCGNEWESTPANRVQNKSGCPVCKILFGSSSVEVRVFSEISSLWEDAVLRGRVAGVECDILIHSIGIAVEVDGGRWHSDVDRDKKKNEVIRKTGLRLIRFREEGLSSSGVEDILYNKQLSFESVCCLIESIGKHCRKDVGSYRIRGEFVGDSTYRKLMERKAVPKGRLLFEHSPHLEKEWDFEKNVDSPYKLTHASHKNVWWVCSRGHNWQHQICIRASQGQNCPFCANRRASKDNCLEVTNPRLASEWDREKEGLTPKDVTSGSGRKLWWKCKNGHSWKETVNNRNHGYGCPYCSRHRKWE